jgi:acyl carrier protein
MTPIRTIVRGLLAHRLERDASALRASQPLEELDIQPLQLVLLALDVETICGVTLPMEDMASLTTIGELLDFVSVEVVRGRRDKALARVA